jgi:hypothetical protein
MHPIFAERMLTPVYDLTSDSSHERQTYIQDFSAADWSPYLLSMPLGTLPPQKTSALVV